MKHYPMTDWTRAIVVNCCVGAGLVLELYWGRSLAVVGISAVLFFGVVNLTLLLAFKRRRRGSFDAPD